MGNCTQDNVVSELKERYPSICESFSTVELEQLVLFARKCLDYGIYNISGGTELKTDKQIQFALNGLWYRMQDKMNRWRTSVESGYTSMKNENLLDTFQDIANYAIIAQLVYRGLWKE